MPSDKLALFEQLGGEFLISPGELRDKLSGTKAFIFDWDGVFNNGIKTGDAGSPFSEVDSMGLNMLRFGYYLKFGFIPEIYIVTGEDNPSALNLSRREHFKAVYLKAKTKTAALAHIQATADLESSAIAFMFDDILDLGLAGVVASGFFVKRTANPLLNEYVRRNNLASYITANVGGHNPVREVCELCLAVLDNFDEVVALRIANAPEYQEYLRLRNQPITAFFRSSQETFEEFQYS